MREAGRRWDPEVPPVPNLWCVCVTPLRGGDVKPDRAGTPLLLLENVTPIFYASLIKKNCNFCGKVRWLFSAKANGKVRMSATHNSLATNKSST